MTTLRAVTFTLLLLPSIVSAAEIAIEPSDPTSREHVFLAVHEIGCSVAEPVVTRCGSVITVEERTGFCAPGIFEETTFHIDLGALTPARYSVVDAATSALQLSFDVRDASEVVTVEPALGSVAGGTPVLITAHPSCEQTRGCTPAAIAFGGVPAGNVVAIGGEQYRATTPPHAGGLVEVRVVSDRGNVAAAVFRYFDPAQPPVPGLFERVLFPVIYNGPGAQGSKWVTEIAGRTESRAPVEIWRGSLGLGSVGAPGPLDFGEAPAGLIIAIPRNAAATTHFSLRVRDTSRESETLGTSIPVVRESQFSSTGIDLLDIPVDRRYRTTLRIYSLSSSPVSISLTFFSMNGGGILGEKNLSLTSSQPCAEFTVCNSERPASAMIGDATAQIPTVFNRIGIHIPGNGAFPLWAFATVTNNETQELTVISPN